MKVGKEVGIRIPPNHSWLEYKLNQQELDYVWRCIDNKKGDYKRQLAGNIEASNLLMDRSDWFFRNTIRPLIHEYESKVGCLGNEFPLGTEGVCRSSELQRRRACQLEPAIVLYDVAIQYFHAHCW